MNSANLTADEQHWQSTSQQATLLELFTSEGCSSCPVADHWLSRWVTRDELWKTIFPVAFHVDYWDDLGWPDKFASPSHSQRQRVYKQQKHSNSVYTPAFMVDGQEWRGFFSRKPFPFTPEKNIGLLQGSLYLNQEPSHQESSLIEPSLQYAPQHQPPSQQLPSPQRQQAAQLTVTFNPVITVANKLTLHIALLGMGIGNDIDAGENHGKNLHHDFVALNFYRVSIDKKSDHYQWQQDISLAPIKGEKIDAIAFWVTEANRMSPLQVTGGLIN